MICFSSMEDQVLMGEKISALVSNNNKNPFGKYFICENRFMVHPVEALLRLFIKYKKVCAV